MASAAPFISLSRLTNSSSTLHLFPVAAQLTPLVAALMMRAMRLGVGMTAATALLAPLPREASAAGAAGAGEGAGIVEVLEGAGSGAVGGVARGSAVGSLASLSDALVAQRAAAVSLTVVKVTLQVATVGAMTKTTTM